MTFADLLTQPTPPIGELRGLWLVIPDDVCATLLDKQAALGLSLSVAPRVGPDGLARALCADVLTELGGDGAYRDLFAVLDPTKFSQVEVKTRDELAALGWFRDSEQ